VDTRATPSPFATPSPPALNVAPTSGANGTVSIETPGLPHAVGAGFGSVWVADHRGGYVYRVDPRTNRVTAAINAVQSLCGALGFGGGAAWVSACGGGPTYKIDAATNRISDEFFKGWGPVYGAGSLWTASIDDGELLRLDPRSGLQLKNIDPGFDTSVDYWHAMTVARGSVWVYTASAVSRGRPQQEPRHCGHPAAR
jgi:streptogramin lyase